MGKKLIYIIIAVFSIAVVALILWLKPTDKPSSESSFPKRATHQKVNNEIQGHSLDNQSTRDKDTVARKTGFVMPNVDWKTRTLKFKDKELTYIFGAGNPPEVALSKDQYTGEGKWQDYVTPQSEAYLKEFLTDGNLKTFIDSCGQKLGFSVTDSTTGFNITNSQDLDINALLTIDPETGRKKFDEAKIFAISQLLYNVSSQLNGDAKIRQCLTSAQIQDFNELHKKFDQFTESYINQPTDGFYDQNNPNDPAYDSIHKTRSQFGISGSN